MQLPHDKINPKNWFKVPDICKALVSLDFLFHFFFIREREGSGKYKMINDKNLPKKHMTREILDFFV